MTVVLRKYRDGNLEAIVDLINKADALDHLDEGTDASAFRELLHRPDFDPYNDAFVVLDEDQSVVGHARLDLKNAPRQARFYVHTVVHPDWRDEPIEELLLEQLWNSAQERRRTLGSKPVQFRTYCAAHQGKRISLFGKLGLHPCATISTWSITPSTTWQIRRFHPAFGCVHMPGARMTSPPWKSPTLPSPMSGTSQQ